MLYLGYFLLIFALIRLGVVLCNLIFRIHLPRHVRLQEPDLISLLIPARNEEKQIGNLLADIQKLSYSHWEVFVYDDLSTDRTAEIVEAFASRDTRIQLIKGVPLPSDWLGKNHACYQLSTHSRGAYLLFLDADVRIKGTILEKSIFLMKKQKLGLLSIFPKQILDRDGTWLSVPLMNWILLSLLPLILVRSSSWTSFSAANGQYMLFERERYKQLQPHRFLRKEKVEDIAICRYLKKNKSKVSTLLGDSCIQCKMYSSLAESIEGFSKNIFSFFGDSVLITYTFILLTSLAPIVVFYTLGIKLGLVYLCCILLIKAGTSWASRQDVLRNLLLLPAQQGILVYLALYAWKKRREKSLLWKGRRLY